MQVVLVRPPFAVNKWSLTSLVVPPLGLAYVAAAIQRAGYRVRCIDAVGEAPFRKTPLPHPEFLSYGLTVDDIVARAAGADVVGISAMFSQDWPLVKSVLQALRRAHPNVITVAGGEHATAVPEFCLRDCAELDICVLGEGEETIVALLSALDEQASLDGVSGIVYRSAQGIARNQRRARLSRLEEIAWPAWDLFPIDNYLDNGLCLGVNHTRSLPLLATRGCPYQCTFCSSPQMWGTRWQARSPQDIIAEMEFNLRRYRLQGFDFYDLTTIINRDWIVDFCNALVNRKLDISWQMPVGTRSEALDAEVCGLLRRSGMKNLVLAPESGSETTLAQVKKELQPHKMKTRMRQAIDSGISIKLNMVIGFPHESLRHIFNTCLFLLRMAWLGVQDVYVMCFTMYPGSQLFEQALAEGKIETLDDEFFLRLCGIHSLKARSYSPYLPDSVLSASRVAAILLFYAASSLIRPARLVRLLRSVLRGDRSSIVGRAWKDLAARLRTAPAAETPVASEVAR